MHLLHNLQEVSQILNDGNRRNSIALVGQTQQADDADPSAGGILSSVLGDIYRRYRCYKLKVTHLYLLLNLLLVHLQSVMLRIFDLDFIVHMLRKKFMVNYKQHVISSLLINL